MHFAQTFASKYNPLIRFFFFGKFLLLPSSVYICSVKLHPYRHNNINISLVRIEILYRETKNYEVFLTASENMSLQHNGAG